LKLLRSHRGLPMRSFYNLLTLISAATLSLGGCANSPPLVMAAPCPTLPSPPAALLTPPELPAARTRLLTPTSATPAPAKLIPRG